jgi:3-methyladenine DNA glycosylase AlkD
MIELDGVTTIPKMRAIRREHSLRLRDAPTVLPLALSMMKGGGIARIFAWELLHHHKPTLRALRTADVRKLGAGIDSWGTVDAFAMYIAGPAWRDGHLTDAELARWARSDDRWWRRAALASAVTLGRAGGRTESILRICSMLAADRDDMVVKALSWALRELTKSDKRAVQTFLETHDLAARVRREVTHKLVTGKKN